MSYHEAGEDKIKRIKWELSQKFGNIDDFTHERLITEALKIEWLSNYEAQALTKSGSGDRRLREILEKPPQGYRKVERKKPCTANCLEHHLTGGQQLSIFESETKE